MINRRGCYCQAMSDGWKWAILLLKFFIQIEIFADWFKFGKKIFAADWFKIDKIKTSFNAKSLIKYNPTRTFQTQHSSCVSRFGKLSCFQIANCKCQCFVNMQALFLCERLQAVQIWTGLNLTSSLDGATWQPFSTWNRF